MCSINATRECIQHCEKCSIKKPFEELCLINAKPWNVCVFPSRELFWNNQKFSYLNHNLIEFSASWDCSSIYCKRPQLQSCKNSSEEKASEYQLRDRERKRDRERDC